MVTYDIIYRFLMNNSRHRTHLVRLGGAGACFRLEARLSWTTVDLADTGPDAWASTNGASSAEQGNQLVLPYGMAV